MIVERDNVIKVMVISLGYGSFQADNENLVGSGVVSYLQTLH